MHLLESVLWAMIKKTFNSLGSVVIKKSDLLNFSELNLEGCLYSMDEFVNSYKLCKQFNCLDKFFKSIPSKMMNEFTSLGWSDTLEDYYKEVIDSQEDLLSNNKTIDDLIKYFKIIIIKLYIRLKLRNHLA